MPVSFFLTAVEIISTGKYEKQLCLFGRTQDRRSVAVLASYYQPYIYVENDFDVGAANAALKPYERAPDPIVRFEEVSKLKAVGYNRNVEDGLLQLFYGNISDKWKILKYAEEKKQRVYHGDVSPALLFLTDFNLKLQDTVTCSDACVNPRKKTTCDLEFIGKFFLPACNNTQLVPAKICAIRHRVFSASSTPSNPIRPTIASSEPTWGRNDGEPLKRLASPSSDAYVGVVCARTYWTDNNKIVSSFNAREEATGDDAKLLVRLSDFVQREDPDCLMFLGDNGDPLCDFHARSLEVDLGRVKGQTTCFNNSITIPGRTIYNLTSDVQSRQISPKLDGYGLLDVAFHPKIIKKPPSDELKTFSYVRSKFLDAAEQLRQCSMEVDVLQEIERGSWMKYSKVSKLTSTSMSSVIGGGQQARLMNLLMRKYMTDGWYFNHEALLSPPFIVKKPRSESDFPDPVFERTTKAPTGLRTVGGKQLETKKKITKKAFTGGNVLDPLPGFYVNEEIVTEDFGSLYPSIMAGYGLDPASFVVSQRDLDDPLVKKRFIPLNDRECAVMVLVDEHKKAKPRGVVPDIIKDLVEQRNLVRKSMKTTKDEFELSALDSEQLGCKVTCNAFYGFFGVKECMKARFRYMVMSACTCAIGRWMSMRAAQHIIESGGTIVYGDTDSIMAFFPRSRGENPESAMEIGTRIGKEITAFYPPPNVFNFESIKRNMWMSNRKKNYMAMESQGGGEPYLVIKGFAFKKRSAPPYARKVGYELAKAIVKDNDIKKAVRIATEGMQNLRRVKIEDLAISCSYTGEYKSEALVQVDVAQKIEMRTGMKVEPGSRFSYVIMAGEGLVSKRADDASRFENQKTASECKLDLPHYCDQLCSLLLPLFEHHKVEHEALKAAFKNESIKLKNEAKGFSGIFARRFSNKRPSDGECGEQPCLKRQNCHEF